MTTAPPHQIGVTGASGFLGQEICRQLHDAGMRVVGFSRTPQRSTPHCDGMREFSSSPDVSGLDAVLHLAGENIFGLWTAEKKRRILESRVEGTDAIAKACAASESTRTLICASAVGFYGNTGDTAVTEDDRQGAGFLAEVSSAWEGAAAPAQTAGVRVAFVRCGMILGSRGGAVRMIRPLFRAGLGGNLGNGRQWMSAIHVQDAAGIFLHLLHNQEFSGAFNAVLSKPFQNCDFTKAVARATNRPALIPAPAFLLRLVLGELSGLMLDSSKVEPRRTLQAGYGFAFPSLQETVTNAFAGT